MNSLQLCAHKEHEHNNFSAYIIKRNIRSVRKSEQDEV